MLCLSFSNKSKAQFVPGNSYEASKVVDPDYGIKIYERLNLQTGGDSVRTDKKGYACQGWVEDKYTDGTLLHKGYYEEGQLKIYKNYFPNGAVERSFKNVDFKRCKMEIFYADGKKKSEVTYYLGNPQIWSDYYANGQLEFTEESTKDMENLIYRKSYLEDGKPQELFEVTDPKKKLYSKKEYYEDGRLKAEGMMHFSSAAYDYQREGAWKVYDESGKESIENYVKGERVTGE
jgi:MORN repeat variant